MRIKSGRFNNIRGQGVFLSFIGENRHLLFALRNRCYLAYVEPAANLQYRRLFVGPLEIEWIVK